MGMFEYRENEIITLNGNYINPQSFDEFYDIIAGQIRYEVQRFGRDAILDEWCDKNPNVRLSSDPERAIDNIIGYTYRWAKDGLWYDGFYDDDVFSIELFMFDPDALDGSKDLKSLKARMKSRKQSKFVPFLKRRK